jgi:hypothetical protein
VHLAERMAAKKAAQRVEKSAERRVGSMVELLVE